MIAQASLSLHTDWSYKQKRQTKKGKRNISKEGRMEGKQKEGGRKRDRMR